MCALASAVVAAGEGPATRRGGRPPASFIEADVKASA